MNRRKFSVEKVHTYTGHTDSIYTLCQGPSPNIIFSASSDGQVAVWDLKSKTPDGTLIAKVPASVYALYYHKPNDLLIIGQNFEGIHFYNYKDKKVEKSLKLTQAAIFDIKVCDNLVWCTTGDGDVMAIRLTDYSLVFNQKVSNKSGRSITCNQNYVAIGFSDQKIRIFTLDNLKIFAEWLAHKNSVFTVQFSPCGTKLLSAGRDAKINVWDVTNNFKHTEEIPAHMFTINHLVYSPDNALFATCSMDKSIKIWDAQNHKLLKVIDKGRHAGHGTSVNKLVWSGFNNELVSASDDTNISVWKLHELNLNNN